MGVWAQNVQTSHQEDFERLKERVGRLTVRVEAIKPRVR